LKEILLILSIHRLKQNQNSGGKAAIIAEMVLGIMFLSARRISTPSLIIMKFTSVRVVFALITTVTRWMMRAEISSEFKGMIMTTHCYFNALPEITNFWLDDRMYGFVSGTLRNVQKTDVGIYTSTAFENWDGVNRKG
jgi:small basic protein